MNQATSDFIRLYANCDVKELALKAHGAENIDLPFALDQIKGRQTARQKLPSWGAIDGIVFPPHLSMEQCSSEPTARYKEQLVEQVSSLFCQKSSFVDLTGGFGVDFSFIARRFDTALYVERQSHLCDIARHNFSLLGLNHAEVVCAEAEDFLHNMNHANVIFLDPARRDTNGSRTFAISDCTPDVTKLKPLLLAKADMVIVKLSPMLDWRKAVADLGKTCVSEVHIVSVENECKELLVVMKHDEQNGLKLTCVDIKKDDYSLFTYFVGSPLNNPSRHSQASEAEEVKGAQRFLYEPNASVMKAGCFDEICKRFEFRQIAHNSHLFLSDCPIDDFPGRSFEIQSTTTMNKREMKAALIDVNRANIAVRNFPLSASDLRKRLKLKDGGDTYIFASTDSDGLHKLFICKKTTKKP